MGDSTDDDEEWTYDLDEVGPEATPQEPPIEPEPVDLEHAVFFLLGVGLVILLLVSLLA